LKADILNRSSWSYFVFKKTHQKPPTPSLEVEKGLHKKEFVITTLLDIKGASDNIKPSAIIKNVCNMYKQYLTNWRCSCTLSDKTVVANLVMGSPQGRILSPFCGWNCAMNELLTRLKKTKTHCKEFANDGALITCNLKLSEAMKDAQKAINVAVQWAKEMGVKFRVEKIVVMLVTKKRASSYKMLTQLRL
jgi:hypothetical protein